jgi:hypothetical protein
MMLLLILNISSDHFHLRFTDREYAVSLLPIEVFHLRNGFMYPTRRSGFQSTQQICDRFIRPPTEQNMNMVFNSVYLDYMSTFAPYDSAEILVNASTMVFGKKRPTMFGAEDEMKFYVRICPRHEEMVFNRPYRGEDIYPLPRVPSGHPWLPANVPPGLTINWPSAPNGNSHSFLTCH